ncbi:D-alanyl-D-alanine carboxypeptidase [Anoxybacter fermentans]|uniref:serine-type D-Ala-D-Ala carboxypeptidase n=2 Tax=Anoxybacter fermentans TaxID=1323375 RepID=A0A3S9T2N0_9FIRM|nr:D-alanyl-D-alanine carboxypeptidase [Anoxybacter fermentans]
MTFLLSLLLAIYPEVTEASLYVTADAAIVIDAETGKVLYGKNIHKRRPPASTTKIMTTILAIELGQLEDRVKASPRAASTGGSSIWLEAGEVLTLEELLYGVMLSSGNDASVAVAEHIAGSVEEFAVLMNQKAKEVGALNTTFQNPHGLPDNQHLTTAYDLAMIMRYAMQNEIFRKLTATKYKTISWPVHRWDRGLRNHNKLLWMYPDCDGGKTGYTRAAGRCLVSTAKRNGRRVIAVVLHADQLWQDSIKLLDYGLDNFSNVTLFKKGELLYTVEIPESREKVLKMVAPRDFVVTVPKGQDFKVTTTISVKENLQLPILAGQKVGSVEIHINGEKVGQRDLIALEEVTEMSLVQRFWRWISLIIKTFA